MKYIQKIIKGILVVGVLGLGLVSCHDTLNDLRDNPNGVTSIDDAALFTNATRSLFLGTTDVSVSRFAGQYAHCYVAGSTARQPDQYTDGFDPQYQDIFSEMYGGVIRHIEDVLEITTSPETENPVRYAIADVIAVMGYARITDGFGEIPYTEGGKGKSMDVLLPKYDTQDFIYKDLIQRLTASIAVLKTADPAMAYGNSDFVFNNDLTKWVRLANSMRLRLGMRLRFADNGLSKQTVTQCLADPLMEDNSHNAAMIQTEGQGNAWYIMRTAFPSIKVSEMMINQLENTADPRLAVFVSKDENGEYTGMINGLTDEAFGVSNFAVKSDMGLALSSKESKLYIMTAAEVWFLRAEAALAYDNNLVEANKLYRFGIETSLLQWEVDGVAINAFMASTTATLNGPTEIQEESIGNQMWVALTPNYYESWSHIRRTGFPYITQRTEPYLSQGVTNGIMPKRFNYSSFELSTNSDNVNEAIARQGANKIDTPVWWDKN